MSAAPKCRCAHTYGTHYRDRRLRIVCAAPVCGCCEYRPRSDYPSPEEQSVLDRFEAAEPAPESWRPE